MKKKYSALPELLLRSIFTRLSIMCFSAWCCLFGFIGAPFCFLLPCCGFALDYSKTIQQLTGKRLLADLLWLGCILISTFIAFFVGYIQGSFASF